MKNEIDKDFQDVVSKEDSEPVKYFLVTILYLVVIILIVLLVLSLKNQKKVVSDSLNEKEVISSAE